MNNKLFNPAFVFILGFITFGIANYVYMYLISEKLGRDSKDELIYPMREVVLNFLTLGVYGIIWTYKTADQLYGNKKNAVICAIISVFPIRCVSMAMLASQLEI